jgi:hypothetical protein
VRTIRVKCVAVAACLLASTGSGVTKVVMPGGSVSGTVFEQGGSTPLPYMRVKALNAAWSCVREIYADGSGFFQFSDLPAGDFYLLADGTGPGGVQTHFGEYYSESATAGGAVSVHVDSGDCISGKHFTLERGYRIQVHADPSSGGSVNLDPAKSLYRSGESVTVKTEPCTTHVFVRWEGGLTGSVNPSAISVSSDLDITAVFETAPPETHTLNVTVTPAGCGTVNRDPVQATYEPAQSVLLTPVAASDYYFKKWEGDTTAADSVIRIGMSYDRNLTAKFEHFVELTLGVDPAGTGTTVPAPGSVNRYKKEAVVPIEAVPASGYKFIQWHCWVADFYDPTTTVTMHDNEHVTAEFAPLRSTLTLRADPAGAGTTDPPPGGHEFDTGETVTIRAIPADGYRFVKWMCPVADPNSPVTTIALNRDETVTAVFEKSRCRLTVNLTTGEGGTARPVGIGDSYHWWGNPVELTAVPDEGFRFVRWHGDVSLTHAPVTSVFMDADKTVSVEFERASAVLTLSVEPPEGGTTRPAPDIAHAFTWGDTASVKARPNPGWRFLRWEGPVDDPETDSTFVVVKDGTAVTARFSEEGRGIVVLTLGANPEDGGSTVPSAGRHTYAPGDTVRLEAFADSGFAFVGWEGPVDDAAVPSTVTVMNGDCAVRARFERNVFLLKLRTDPESGGTTDPEKGSHWFPRGERVSITAEPKPGWGFAAWEGPVEDPGSATTVVTVDSNVTVTARFTMEDASPPVLMDCWPPDGSSFIPANAKIQFKAKDFGSGVDPASLQVRVGGTILIENGEDRTGGRTSVSRGDRKVCVVLHPENGSEGTVTVHVRINDLARPPNVCDSTFSFSVGLIRTDTLAAAVVDAGGGNVEENPAGLQLHVPAEALGNAALITIEKADTLPPLPDGLRGMSLSYHFGPDGLEFDDWVTVRIPYTQQDLDAAGAAGPELLKVYYFHTSDARWIQLPVDSVDAVSHFLFAKIKQFCYLTLAREPEIVSGIGRNAEPVGTPARFGLSQNYPNPFNPSTRVRFDLAESGPVRLVVVDASGRTIRTLVNGILASGFHEIEWTATNDSGNPVAAGVYCFSLNAGGRALLIKALYVK